MPWEMPVAHDGVEGSLASGALHARNLIRNAAETDLEKLPM
jgi:hypothetical protein